MSKSKWNQVSLLTAITLRLLEMVSSTAIKLRQWLVQIIWLHLRMSCASIGKIRSQVVLKQHHTPCDCGSTPSASSCRTPDRHRALYCLRPELAETDTHRWSRSISSLATSLPISSFLSLRTILRQMRTFSIVLLHTTHSHYMRSGHQNSTHVISMMVGH